MVTKSDLEQIGPLLYEIPASRRRDMRVSARLYANAEILEMAAGDRSLEQLVNTTTLPGVVGYTLAMPDIHQGYGFPIGGVAATELPEGVISPGGVGYDINCGVRVLTSSIEAEKIRPHMNDLMNTLFHNISAGVGASGRIELSRRELTHVLEEGSHWAVRKGYGPTEDARRTEDGGCIEAANAGAVSKRAMERGATQVGTLGAGNHFLEVDEVTEVYDQQVAKAFGLGVGQVCVWIHCGSRGFGHQVCSDAVRSMQQSVTKYGIELPDRELACVPFESPEGQAYFQAMNCAANYAWANRQVITQLVRSSFEDALGGRVGPLDLRMLYDVCHNIAKIEWHPVDGRMRELCVHRKGATRAFGPGREEVPGDYRPYGQPVLIPGNMSSGSYVLVGTTEAMNVSFGSSCHGAGRTMSRSKARRGIRGEALRAELESANITVRARSMRGLAEEAPHAYKDLDLVVDVVHRARLARKVARTRPLGVIKG